jgi:ribosomal-protein-alanine N-acetyltransferase
MSLPSPVHIETERLVLTMPGREDAALALAYHERNRAHLMPWNPPIPDSFYTLAHWEQRLEEARREHIEDRSLRLWVFERGDASRTAIGAINYTNFIRAALQATTLGYSIDATKEGRGFMHEALAASIRYVFDELGMHRIQAGYVPENARSARVLDRLGFTIEGYARDYLYIAGAWRDHVLTSLTSPTPRPAG